MKDVCELDLTMAINHLLTGKATEQEQVVCGIVLKSYIQKPKVKPNYNANNKPYCPNCDQPLNVKMKNGMNIFQYCKCCGQAIDWEV